MSRFADSKIARVALLLSNKEEAYALKRAEKFSVPTAIIGTPAFSTDRNAISDLLDRYRIDLIVLAGFLLKIPPYMLEKYPRRILNIHPALLPKYGGKGMYGSHVHEAVIAAGEKESGITIHLCDEILDHGEHLYQAKCTVEPGETPESLAAKIHQLEKAYPEVIERYILNNIL